MSSNQSAYILEGVLGELHPKLFAADLDRHGERRVRMLVATPGAGAEDALPQGTFYRPGRQGQAPEFGWRAAGPLQNVLRQFRLEFLRHLGPAEMAATVKIVIRDDVSPLDGPHRPAPVPLVDIEPDAKFYSYPPLPPARATEPGGDNHKSETPAVREPIVGASPRALIGNFYQEYFGFECMPFNNTLDTHFFYPSEKHQEALSRLIYAISERKGFVMISGAIGSGKSTLCRVLLGQLPKEVKTAVITQTQLTSEQLVHAIAEDFGIETKGLTRYETLIRLNEWLIEQLAAGTTPVLIIDEAQNLSAEVLEEVRMITNLETEQEKLLQLILLGQPELRQKVRLPELRQLRQRIAVQYHLEPLSRQETKDYIVHRLKIANPTRALHFRRGAMNEAFLYSGGVPRLVNTLCDQALLAAFTAESRDVTARMVRDVAKDLDLEPSGPISFFRFW
ncbi:AAA family ATPase [bacterium]|nr:AAA family ATPase [bacterium]